VNWFVLAQDVLEWRVVVCVQSCAFGFHKSKDLFIIYIKQGRLCQIENSSFTWSVCQLFLSYRRDTFSLTFCEVYNLFKKS
jgi:hypothetical protein